jgi:hypothetical protein
MNKKGFGCFGAIVIFLILAYVGAWFIAPGSYPKAETYIFNVPEDTLLTIIEQIKKENPELVFAQKPNQHFYLEEGRRDTNDYWYSIYFYYPDKNEILHTWTRPKTKTSTTFAFVGIKSGLTLGNWREVNGSFWWWENKPDKEEFEKRILKKIQEKAEVHHAP